MRKSFLAVVSLAAIIFLAANPALTGDAPKLVGLAIPEAGTDKGWNEQGKVGLETTAKKYGFRIELAEALGYGDIKPTLRDMVQKGCQLIICHAAGYQIVAPEIARETGVRVVTVENHKDVTPGLISDIDTQPQGGCYLAGWLAGKTTRSNIVGIVTSAEPPTWNRMSAGFAQGLKASNPKARLLYNVIGEEAYADAAGGKRNTEAQIAVGADVIFGLGDGASFGMLQACSTQKARDGGKIWFIDVIGDKRTIDKADVLLSSVIMDMSVVYDEVIKSFMDGSFGRQHWVSMDNGAIYLLQPNKAVSSALRAELAAVQKKILSGKIEVVDLPAAADLHQFMDKQFPK
jgi:simple sugar transport system substrate-binding protein